LSSIFSLDYDIYSIQNTAYYCSFKFKEYFNFDIISNVINNIENLLKNPDINKLIDQKSSKFVKNKYINYLPYEDKITLKMELFYNPKDLLKVIKNNKVILIGSTKFKKWGV